MSTATKDALAGHLLDDLQVVDFIVNGYHLVEPDLRPGLNETIAAKLDAMQRNPGDAICDEVPELNEVLDHPAVRGALVSLAGADYEVMFHRHWHCKEPRTGYMHWHQDGKNRRSAALDRFLGLYYPADVNADMGPTIIVPATQYRNAPTDRMRTYGNIRGQVPLVVKAGTFAITHYDLWHGTAANRSGKRRHMVKFLFARTQERPGATWNHDPQCMNVLRDWNLREQAQTHPREPPTYFRPRHPADGNAQLRHRCPPPQPRPAAGRPAVRSNASQRPADRAAWDGTTRTR